MTVWDGDITRTIPWAELAGPLVAAEDAVARLDERLARSPVRDGFVERFHFHDAAAVLWLEGELVHVEDLVLHDAHMDIRTPTHELTRAHAVLRSRRQISGNAPDWALGRDGMRRLTGRDDVAAPAENGPKGEGALSSEPDREEPIVADEPDPLAEELAAIDAVLARSSAVLEGAVVARPLRPQAAPERDPLIYDPEWDEQARLEAWRETFDRIIDLPPVLAAAILWDAWEAASPCSISPGLGLCWSRPRCGSAARRPSICSPLTRACGSSPATAGAIATGQRGFWLSWKRLRRPPRSASKSMTA